jgi:HTH-type transcriptional regulator, competence development regulator
MDFPAKSFGKLLRERRLAWGFGLREFATLVGVSSTYISQLQQENIDPPPAERAAKMAEILGENADEWISLAGRIPDDLEGIIQNQPIVIPALLSETIGLTVEQLRELADQAKKMKEANQWVTGFRRLTAKSPTFTKNRLSARLTR